MRPGHGGCLSIARAVLSGRWPNYSWKGIVLWLPFMPFTCCDAAAWLAATLLTAGELLFFAGHQESNLVVAFCMSRNRCAGSLLARLAHCFLPGCLWDCVLDHATPTLGWHAGPCYSHLHIHAGWLPAGLLPLSPQGHPRQSTVRHLQPQQCMARLPSSRLHQQSRASLDRHLPRALPAPMAPRPPLHQQCTERLPSSHRPLQSGERLVLSHC